jgi:hypothetical protein
VKATANAAATTPEHEQTGFRPVGSSSAPDGSAIVPVSGPQYAYTHHPRMTRHALAALQYLSAAKLMSKRSLASNFPKRLILMFRVSTRHLRGPSVAPAGPQHAQQPVRRHGHNIWSISGAVPAARHQHGGGPGDALFLPETHGACSILDCCFMCACWFLLPMII